MSVRRQRRFRLSYPHYGSKIYKTKSSSKAAKVCYKEFKELNDIQEGFFVMQDLDNNKKYEFQVQEGQISKVKQSGGTNELLSLLNDLPPLPLSTPHAS